MEIKFNFNSNVCTSKIQSERLLALGLKKETADMCHFWHWESDDYSRLCASWEFAHRSSKDIPAWSLHRLIAMMPKNIAIDGDTAYPLQIQKRSDGKWCVGYQGWYDCVGDLYDSVIWIYQLLISEGYIDEEFCNKG